MRRGYRTSETGLRQVSPLLKFVSCLMLVGALLAASHPLAGIQMVVWMEVLAVAAGGIRPARFLKLLAVPGSFLVLSGVAVLLEYGRDPSGIFRICLGPGYLYMTKDSLWQAAVLTARAWGAASVLLLFGVTTTMAELTGVLRSLRCPRLLCSLMYLMYRYIFLVYESHRVMKQAAASRLGYRTFPLSLAATGKIYRNLLAVSYRQAVQNFDAMESRCFRGEVRFLPKERKSGRRECCLAAVLVMAEWLFCLWYR